MIAKALESPIRSAYESVQATLDDVHWRDAAAPRTLELRVRDASCWMDMMLEEVRVHDRAALDEDRALLVHDAFIRVLALATALQRADATSADDLQPLRETIDDLLDTFAPLLGPADAALRRLTLDGKAPDDALRCIDRQLGG